MNTVVVLFLCVYTNGFMHIHILECISWLCLFRIPTVVIFQCKVLLPSLWWLFTFLPVLIWDLGHDLFLNILHQNHRQSRWNLLGDCCVEILPGYYLRDGIHKVPGVWQGHHVWFVLFVGVHKYPWLPVWRCIHCAPCPWDFIYPQIIVGSWISVSLCILLYPCDYSGLKKNSMHIYIDLMSEMVLLTCSLIVIKSDVGVLNYPG